MPMLSDLIGLHHRGRPIGIVIDEDDQTFALAEEAINQYSGYAFFVIERVLFEQYNISPEVRTNDAFWDLVANKTDAELTEALGGTEIPSSEHAAIITWLKDTAKKEIPNKQNQFNMWLSLSEWAIIKPLFELYVERENAMHLEASRVLGVDVYGRGVSEVKQDINQYHEMMHKKAFIYPVITV